MLSSPAAKCGRREPVAGPAATRAKSGAIWYSRARVKPTGHQSPAVLTELNSWNPSRQRGESWGAAVAAPALTIGWRGALIGPS